MVDLLSCETAEDLFFHMDASKKSSCDIGAVFGCWWLFSHWEEGYIARCDPSIEYLELYGVVVAILTWGHLIQNKRIIIYCDNTAVVSMINNMTSSCQNCMFLLRVLVLNNLINNHRIQVKYVNMKINFLADSLSRLQFTRFWKLAPADMLKEPSKPSPLVWPASKI